MRENSVLRGTVSLFLTLCLLLSMVPTRVLAAGDCICTDKCSFSSPNAACPHCSSAEEGDFQCRGGVPGPRASANIGSVTYTGGTLLDSMAPADVVLTRQDASIPGTLRLTASRLTAGTADYGWQFTPADSGYEPISGTISLAVAHDWTEGSCTEAPTCRGCGQTNGSAPGHTLFYSAAGTSIIETCSTTGFEHSGTVTLERIPGVPTEYTGEPIKPLKLSYSDSWAGPRDLEIVYESNTGIGTATGCVTVGGVTARMTFEIQPVSMDVTAPDLELTYDGAAHAASVTAPQGAVVRYGTKSGTYNLSECPDYTNAGDYTVYYQVTKENHRTVEGSFGIRIRPVALTIRADDGEKVYGEEGSKEFSWKIISGKLVDGESLAGITVSRRPGEDAGRYAIIPSQSGGNSNYSITFQEGTYTIHPRQITITWSGLELSYNGTEQAPKATAGNTAFGDRLELTVSGGRTDATKGQKVTARVTGITGDKAQNYTLPGEVSVEFEIKKAAMEEPRLRYTDETVEGKNDGVILDVTSDMEYRREDQETYTAVTGTKIENLAPGKYFIRYAESDNCFVSVDAQVVIGKGSKLKITLPKEQPGYTLTVDPKEVAYDGSAVLRFTLQEGCEKAEGFAIKVNGNAVTLKPDGTCELKNIRENLAVTVEGVEDAQEPTAAIRIGSRSWDSFLAGVTYGIYFNEAQTVTITAEDEGTGVDKIHYHLAFNELTLSQLKAVYNWKEYTAPFSIRPDNQYVIYVRVTDKTGNVCYINSDGIILDELQPDINGVKNRGIYYTTQKVTAADNFKLAGFKLNGGTFGGTISGDPAMETKHTLTAWDMAGNSTTLTITMMPIASLGEGLPELEDLTLEDKAVIEEVLEKVQSILKKECQNATARERQALEELEERCQSLLKELEAVTQVAELLEALPDPAAVRPDEKNTIDALDAAQEAYDALSQREKQMLGSWEDTLNALRKAMTAYRITEGGSAKWTSGDTKGLTFIANGYYGSYGSYAPDAYGKFLSVEVDGELLEPEHYTARSGSTVITLKTSYLETLDTGKHTIRLRYIDGDTEEATFRISQPIRLADAGNGAGIIGILFWCALGLACLVGIILIVLLIVWKKDKK